MAARQYPTTEYLRQAFDYRDGKLFWRVRPTDHFKNSHGQRLFNSRYSGKLAGRLNTVVSNKQNSRWVLFVDKKYYMRSVIVWLWHGKKLNSCIDHENRNSLDDRIENLREATLFQNQQNKNKYRNNKSGYKGVSWNKKSGKWAAVILANGSTYYLGFYSDIKDAVIAYNKKASELHGEFAFLNPVPA